MHSQSRCEREKTKPFRSDMAKLERKDCREVDLDDNTLKCLYFGFLITISCLLKTVKNIYYVIIVLKLKEVTRGFYVAASSNGTTEVELAVST